MKFFVNCGYCTNYGFSLLLLQLFLLILIMWHLKIAIYLMNAALWLEMSLLKAHNHWVSSSGNSEHLQVLACLLITFFHKLTERDSHPVLTLPELYACPQSHCVIFVKYDNMDFYSDWYCKLENKIKIMFLFFSFSYFFKG